MIQVQELTAPLATAAAAAADPLTIVQREMLEPAGLDVAVLDRAMGELMARRLDYGDLYFQSTRFESWSVLLIAPSWTSSQSPNSSPLKRYTSPSWMKGMLPKCSS